MRQAEPKKSAFNLLTDEKLKEIYSLREKILSELAAEEGDGKEI